jgi:uncharacterized iron-regulated protein
VGAAAAWLAGCSSAAPDVELKFTRPVVLLGEVHDNAAQHALRRRAFEAALAQGARPALLMEQLDRDRQPAIDRLLAQRPPPGVDALLAAAGPAAAGWNWDFYKPYLALALQYRLPIVAANVSRSDARQVMSQGLQANGFDAAVPREIEDGIAAAIVESHCGLIDEPTARRMALGQVARDQFMARSIERHAGEGVLLLAGNGHVRIDLGVPRWLSPATRARSESIGVLERGDGAGGGAGGDEAAAFDRVVYTAPQQRTDPCDGMRKPGTAAAK